MKFRPTRTDRLSPAEREIVDRFERGLIDAAEAGRLLIDSVHSVRHGTTASADEEEAFTEETDTVALNETPEEAEARALVERIARDVYDDST
jgi:RecA-family ATPase